MSTGLDDDEDFSQAKTSPSEDPFYLNKTLSYYGAFAATAIPPVFGLVVLFGVCDCVAYLARWRIKKRNPEEWRRFSRRQSRTPTFAHTQMMLNAMRKFSSESATENGEPVVLTKVKVDGKQQLK